MKTMLSLDTLDALRTRLICEHERLQEQIAELRTAEGLDQPRNSLERREEVIDQAEQALDQAEWDRMHIAELTLTDRLEEVEHALAKFEGSTYGLCEACGAPIPESRLLAVPAARFDLEHEVALEQHIHTALHSPNPAAK